MPKGAIFFEILAMPMSPPPFPRQTKGAHTHQMLSDLKSIRVVAIAAASLCVQFASAQSAFVNFETPQVHPIDITPSGEVLVAVNTADNHLEVYDLVAGTPVRRGSVFTGLEPVSVRVRGNGEAWVVNQLSDSVSLVNLQSMRLERTVLVGDEPADIVFAGSPQRAWVSLAQPRQIVAFDPLAASPALTTIGISGSQPRALATSPDGSCVCRDLRIGQSVGHRAARDRDPKLWPIRRAESAAKLGKRVLARGQFVQSAGSPRGAHCSQERSWSMARRKQSELDQSHHS